MNDIYILRKLFQNWNFASLPSLRALPRMPGSTKKLCVYWNSEETNDLDKCEVHRWCWVICSEKFMSVFRNCNLDQIFTKQVVKTECIFQSLFDYTKSLTAMGFEPTTSWLVNEHSTIYPNWTPSNILEESVLWKNEEYTRWWRFILKTNLKLNAERMR